MDRFCEDIKKTDKILETLEGRRHSSDSTTHYNIIKVPTYAYTATL